MYRRFAIAHNFFIGAVIAAGGIISLIFALQRVTGSALTRVICAGLAFWWGGRLAVLPWPKAHRHLQSTALRVGYLLLLEECALFAVEYGFPRYANAWVRLTQTASSHGAELLASSKNRINE